MEKMDNRWTLRPWFIFFQPLKSQLRINYGLRNENIFKKALIAWLPLSLEGLSRF